MSTNTLNVRLRNAVKTEAEWIKSDPVLLKGEAAYSSDKKLYKIGDGTSKWSELSYNLAESLVGLAASVTELNYMDGVTSNVQTQLNNKSDKGHGHSDATTSASGFMSSADKKFVNNLKIVDLGNMSGKTITELQTALVEWLKTHFTVPNSTCMFTADFSSVVSLWNNDDGTTIKAGSANTVELKTYYSASDYALLQITSYYDKKVYYVARSSGSWKPIRTVIFADDTIKNATNATLAVTATNVSATQGTVNVDRHVWFSDSNTETSRAYDDDFKYNPSTNTLTVKNIVGNASTATSATKATQDGSGNNIVNTYATKTALNTTNSNVTKAQTTADEAKAAINGLEIGGRNLVSGTSDKYQGYTLGTYYTRLYHIPISDLMEKYGLKNGDKITYSAQLKSSSKPLILRLQHYNTDSDRYNTYSSTYIDSGNEGRLFVTTTLNTSYQYLDLLIGNNASTTMTDNSTEYAKCVKLEKGNKATDWTPAIEDIYAEIDGVQSDIDNLEIGGRNYILSLENQTYTLNGITTEVKNGVWHVYGTNTNKSSAYGTISTPSRVNIFEPGETYTLSTTTPLPTGLYIGLNTRTKSGVTINAGQSDAYLYGDGTRKSITFTANSNTNGSMYAFVGVRESCGTVDVTFQIKLEKGSIATDWTPAPEEAHPTITKSTDTTSTAAPIHGGTFTAVDSITRDANGHVTKVNTKTITLPGDNNTDTKVTQTHSTTNSYRALLMSASYSAKAAELGTEETGQVYKNTSIVACPATGEIQATKFTGALAGNATTATTATKATYLTVSKIFDPTNVTVDAEKLKVYDSYNVEGTPTTYGNVLEINGISGHWKPQLWFDGTGSGSKIRYRNRGYNSTKFSDWVVLLDSSNYSSYALPLSGGTLTGDLNLGSKKIVFSNPNEDITLLQVGTGTFGYRLQYNGTGSGNNNTLALISDNQEGTEVNAIVMKQDGSTTFAKKITASGGITGALTGNADTADKLKTARTINGTSFDGSSSITTANWGTARTITIGNTGKSVNGSENVSWSHSEMGVPKTVSSYSFGGDNTDITTDDFITLLTDAGAFKQRYWITRGGWAYANNRCITDTGCGKIHLAGCTVEVISSNTSAYTIRVHAPTTSSKGEANADWIYVNNGSDYSPGWRRLYSNKYKPEADKWTTARKITLTGSVTGSVSIDGSGDVSLTTTTNHTHNYLPLSGGSMTGSITFANDKGIYNANSYILLKYDTTNGTIIGSTEMKTTVRSNGNLYHNSYTILDSNNYSSYALPKSGGALTGSLEVINKYNLGSHYNYNKGYLIEIGAAKASTMVAIHITGNSYNSSTAPINSMYQFYDYGDGTTMHYTARNWGLALGDMTVYRYDGKLYAFIKQTASYQTLSFELITNKSGLKPKVSNSAAHTSGYSDLITITPDNVSISGHTHSYLPLSGGTITSSSSDTPLYIKGNVTTATWIGFKNSGGTSMGFIGVNSSKQPVFYDTASRIILHENNYSSYALPLTGGKLTGNIEIKADDKTFMSAKVTNSNGSVGIYAGTNRGLYDFTNSKWLVYTDGTNVYLNGNANTATKADKLSTARTISLTGSVTGSGTFDGSGNLSIATTTNHTHSYLPLSGGTLTGDVTFKDGEYIMNSNGYLLLGYDTTNGTRVGSTEKKTTIRSNGSLYHNSYTVLDSNNYKTYCTLANIGAAAGASASDSTPATAGWYRIATTTAGIGNNLGMFLIVASGSGYHTDAIITAGTSFGNSDGSGINVLHCTHYNNAGFTKARIVYHTTYSGNYAHLEVYQNCASALSVTVRRVTGAGWSLVAPSTAGSIPSGYLNKEVALSNNTIVAGTFSGKLTGNADTATTAGSTKLLKYNSSLATNDAIDGFLETNTFKAAIWKDTSSPGVGNGIILSGGWSSTSYGFQLAIDDDPTYFMALRQRNGDGWKAWKRIPMGDGTGASGTWAINVTGSAASATKATQDGNGNVITSTYLAKSGGTITGDLTINSTLNANNNTKAPFTTKGNLYLVNKKVDWNANSYIQHVILLLPVPTASNWSGMNYFDGKFLCWKTGANVYDVVEVNLNCVYNTLRYHIQSYGDYNTSWKLCVCKYNNVLYYALKCPYHANPYTNVEFIGHVNSTLAGGISNSTSSAFLPLDVAYYNENSKTVLNSEVNGSITDTLTTTAITSTSSSALYSHGGFSGSLSGNASTASKWKTARTLTLTGSVTGSVSIDGSGNVSLATTTNHTHSYLPLSGGTLTVNSYYGLTIKRSDTNGAAISYQNSSGAIGGAGFLSDGNFQISSGTNTSGNIMLASTTAATFPGTVTATTFNGALNGNASTATRATSLGTNDTIKLYANNNNELNFGGTNTSSTIYFGYRATDSRPIPTNFVFGSSTGTASVTASGFIAATSNALTTSSVMKIKSSSTMYLNRGSATSLIFQMNDAEHARFNTAGHFVPGTTNTYNIGASDNVWKNIYATTFTGALSGNATSATRVTISDGSTDGERNILVTNAATSGQNVFSVPGVTANYSKKTLTASGGFIGNVTGNADTSSALKYHANLTTDDGINGFLEASRLKTAVWTSTSSPGVSNGIIISGGYTSATYGFQLAIDDDPTYFMALRQKGTEGWKAWKRIPMGDGTGASGSWGISITGNAATATTANTASAVKDSGNSTSTTFAYSKDGLTTASWLAAWNGYELRAISPANLRTTINAAPASGSYHYMRVYNASNITNSNSVTFNDLAKQYFAAGMIYAATDNPMGYASWCHGLSMSWSEGVNTSWISQLAFGTNASNGMWYRTTSGSIVGAAWKRVLDSSNYTSYCTPKNIGAPLAKMISWGTSLTVNCGEGYALTHLVMVNAGWLYLVWTPSSGITTTTIKSESNFVTIKRNSSTGNVLTISTLSNATIVVWSF